MKTERITILVTPEEKALVGDKADALGLNASEFIRLAVERFDVDRNEALLAAVVDRLGEAVADMNDSLDRTNARIETTVRGLRERRLARQAALDGSAPAPTARRTAA